MKKISVLALALVMILSLTACGGAAVTMVDVTTDQGISLKLPSDLKLQDNLSYLNTETGDNVMTGSAPVGETPLSGWTEANVAATYASKYEDVVVTSFDNTKMINDQESLVSGFTLKTPAGNALT